MGNSAKPMNSSNDDASQSTVDLLDVWELLRRHSGLALGVPSLAGLLGFLASFLIAPKYQAATTFIPELGTQNRLQSLGALTSVAGQLGLGLGIDRNESP